MANNTTTERGRRAPKGVLGRLIRTVFSFYPVLLPVTLICILINAIVSSMPSPPFSLSVFTTSTAHSPHHSVSFF